MKTTQETIREIERLLIENGTYAVLYGQDQYDEVDWQEIARYFKTERIDGYTQGDKIVIRLPEDPDVEVPEPFVKSKRNPWDYVALLFFGIGVATVIREIWRFIANLIK